jgi:hypothetical protein
LWNYFLGRDPARWRAGVCGYLSVRYEDLYPGVDLRLREESGRFEYDLEFVAGSEPSVVAVRCEGIEGMTIDREGTLVLATALGPLRQGVPRSWQVLPGGERRPMEARFRLLDGNRFGFEVCGSDPAHPLVIDPGLEWSTYLGATDSDRVSSVAQGPTGEVTVTGWTLSPSFPTTPGAYDSTYNGTGTMPSMNGDVFVARFTTNGSALVYSTFLGGSDNDHGEEVVLFGTDAIVSGWTHSTDFPATPGAFDTTHNGNGLGTMFGGGDLYVTRLNATGSALVYSTYIGGDDLEYVISMGAGPTGEVTVAGHVHSANFPVTPGAFQTALTRFSDCYVTRLNAAGNGLVGSTFFGGLLGEDYPYAMVVHPTGETSIVGSTSTPDLPVTVGAYDTTYNGGSPGSHLADVFAARFDATASTLLWSTFLGGSDDDAAFGIAVDASGAVTLTGDARSSDYPTTAGAFDTTLGGGGDAVVSRLSSTGSALLWSTFLGGTGDDRGDGLGLDPSGFVTVAGGTMSAGFPVTVGAYDTSHNGNNDVFVAKLDPTASTLLYSTFLGGSSWEHARTLALDATGAATVGGEVFSFNFPTTPGAFGTTASFNGDGFVSRLDLLPAGVTKFGSATPGCSGPSAIGVSSIPQIGNGAFAVTCSGAPLGMSGLLALGGALAAPLPVLGLSVWIDTTSLFVGLPAVSNPAGFAAVPIPIPPIPGLAGGTVSGQFGWLDCGTPPLSASNALTLVVQP